MTTFYSRQISNAKRIIRQRGAVVNWHRPEFAENSVYPELISDNSSSVIIAFLPLQEQRRKSLVQKGIETSSGHFQGYMGAVDFTPSQKDYVTANGSRYNILDINTIAPDLEQILHIIVFEAGFVI